MRYKNCRLGGIKCDSQFLKIKPRRDFSDCPVGFPPEWSPACFLHYSLPTAYLPKNVPSSFQDCRLWCTPSAICYEDYWLWLKTVFPASIYYAKILEIRSFMPLFAPIKMIYSQLPKHWRWAKWWRFLSLCEMSLFQYRILNFEQFYSHSNIFLKSFQEKKYSNYNLVQ